MAQLLRRTKKCCVKILRKLSFKADSPCTTTSSRKSNSTQHQLQHSSRNGRCRIAPSPLHTGKYAFDDGYGDGNQTSPEDLSIESDFDGNHRSNNNNSRLKNSNITKCFRISHKNNDTNQKHTYDSDTYQYELNDINGIEQGKGSDSERSIIVSEEIIFTENRIYIGLTERQNLQKSNGNSNSKVDKETFDFSLHRNTNQNLTTTTSFGDTRKCSEKLNFNNVNRNSPTEMVMAKIVASDNQRNYDEIVFEKVKYDRNKKYLHTSPSISSGNTAYSNSSLKKYLNQDDIQAIPNTKFTSQSNSQFASNANANRLPSIYDNVDHLPWIKADPMGPTNPWEESSSIDSELISNNQSDPWHFLNNHLHSKKSSGDGKGKYSKCNGIHYENVSSSRRTSVSTTETWIDDEIFDNSFNEELEKRCGNLV